MIQPQTKKQQSSYDHYNHFKDFGIKLENDSTRYEITLSTDQKQIEKKIGACGIQVYI